MEDLKKFDEITKPDSRQEYLDIVNDDTGEMRPLTLRDIYAGAASIELSDKVPENVRNHFSTARNLLVYSWFYYPFNVTAQFLAFVSVEMALKTKYKVKKGSFKELLKRAVDEGLVKNEGFTHIQQKDKDMPELPAVEMMSENVKSYAKILIEAIPFLRNELAHGSTMLHPDGASSVRISAELINQIFAE